MNNKPIDVRTGAKEPMSNPKTSLSNAKYSPNGSGSGKSEGPIDKSDKNINLGGCNK